MEKKANSVYNEMCAAKQKPDENEVTFLLRLCGLRKRVEKLSIEEGRPMDDLVEGFVFLVTCNRFSARCREIRIAKHSQEPSTVRQRANP